RWAPRHILPFTLLVDDDHRLADEFGFWKRTSFAGKENMGVERSTVVIGSASTRCAFCKLSASVLVLERGIRILVTAALAAVFVFPAQAAPTPMVEVVVSLDAPPLATAIKQSRVLAASVKAKRLDLASPTSVAYVRSLVVAQRQLAARITTTIPASRVTW